MEGLAVLAALVVVGIPVAVIVLIVSVVRLRDRVGALEREVRALRRRAAPPATVFAPEPASAPPASKPAAPPEALPAVSRAEPPPIPPLPPAVEPEAGPWRPGPAAPSAPAAPVVLSAERASALGNWLKANWVYAVSALSLAFAGIFFVQYGMEKGLLPPAARVIMAILFGMALVVAGEVIRRRSGDEAGKATAYLPSTFSGAGIVSMFAGVLAARQLYGLIGAEVAFGGLVAVAALAVVLGWFYGPFLAAVGLVGAAAAPFVVGGSSDAAHWLYGNFALIAGAGLAIDAVRRWAWVSVLALALVYGGGWLVLMASGGPAWAALFMTGVAVLSVLVPCLRLAPDHQGPIVAEALWSRGAVGWPIFPTRLAAGSVTASTLGLLLLSTGLASESLLAFLCLAVLAGALTFWSDRAPALSDLGALPAAAFILRLAFEGLDYAPLYADFADRAIALRQPETAAPWTVTGLVAMATALTLLAAWTSGRAARWRPVWAAGAALVAPLAAVALELFWTPALVIGAYIWALHAIALAVLMAFLATRFAAADGEDRRRAAYAVLSCLSLIALALFLVATKGALTVALAALVAVAAWLDRRFRLPEMGWFIQAAILGLSWRLVIDPGLGWAIDEAAPWEVWTSYGGAALAMAGGLWLLGDLDRRGARVFLESAGAAHAALLANVLITRWLASDVGAWAISHWGLTLNALPWLIVALTQLYRLQLGGPLHWLRWGIAGVAGLIAAAGIAGAAGPSNPLFGLSYGVAEGLVYGPPVLDTLLVAYGLPAVILFAALTRLGHLRPWLGLALAGVAAVLAAVYVGLEIRRLWRGDDLSVPGVTQPELYSYTIALMILGAGLLYQAIARNSATLRRAGMAVIALTVAKVFLIDASGLSGLTRVFSFLALGLSLAGLAWLNRWAAGRQEGAGT